jgi:hypothetical protein
MEKSKSHMMSVFHKQEVSSRSFTSFFLLKMFNWLRPQICDQARRTGMGEGPRDLV